MIIILPILIKFYQFINCLKTGMSSSDPSKKYPKNEIYSQSYKPTFQQASKSSQSKNITNVSGTSLGQLSLSSKSGKNTTEISILHQRIQYLQKQLEIVTQLLSEEDTKKNIIDKLEKQVRDLQENLEKTQEINNMLENQLMKSEGSNQQLLNALKVVNQQLQALKSEQTDSKHTKKQNENVNDSKTSMKSRQQIEQDIIRLNEQISNILMKLHTLNEDYENLREKNERLEAEKQVLIAQLNKINSERNDNKQLQNQRSQMSNKISSLEQSLSQSLKNIEKYRNQYEYAREQINLLKQQIQQVNELSIRKQKQIQDQYYQKQRQWNEQLQSMKSQLRESRVTVISRKQSENRDKQDQSSLIEIKNVMIRKLELDNQVLKQEIQSLQRDIRRNKQNQRNMSKQYDQSNRKIQQLNEAQNQKIFLLQRNYQQRIVQLEQQIHQLKSIESKMSSLQTENYDQRSQMRAKQQKIYQLEEDIRQYRRKQSIIQTLEQQIKDLKYKQQYKDEEFHQVQTTKLQIAQELSRVRKQLENVQNEVRNTNEIKQKYGNELSALKNKMKQLVQSSHNQARYIKQIESSHENSRKKIQDFSILTQTNIQTKTRTEQLQYNNKQLQKMFINERVEKQNQNKRYRQLLEDYKQLNNQLSTQLQMYRDASNPDHPSCPIKDIDFKSIKDSRQRPLSRKSDSSQIRKQMEKQKARYHSLLEQHQKTLQRYKGIQGKLHHLQKSQKEMHFLKIDNSSLRTQVSQLNIRIQEYKNTIESMKSESDNRHIDAQRLRYAIQRQYEGKMQVQRMQIINQYNVLLRNRNVRIQPTQYQSRPQLQPLQPTFSPSSFPSTFPFPSGQFPYSNLPESLNSPKLRHHPQYKHLQQQYLKLHRNILQLQQNYNKNLTQLRDQVQKLKIENEYHRKTIDQLHAEGYGIYEDGSSVDSRHYQDSYKNKFQEISRNYQKLYQDYVSVKSQIGHHQNIFRPNATSDGYRLSQAQRSQLIWLRKLIDQKLSQLELTPRQAASTVERATWLIEKLSALVLQLRQDHNTLKNQKKQSNKENDRLKVKIETLEYENSHLLKQLSVVAQKFKYLQQRNLKMANGSKEFQTPYKPAFQIPKINIDKSFSHHNGNGNGNSSNQKDVHFHQAGLIREQRLALLKKYQREIQTIQAQNL